MSTFKDLLPLAAQVRDATEEGENTGKRVGDLFVDIIQEIESYVTDNDEDKRDTKNELIKRIQGTSDASKAMTDPFKFVDSFNSSTIGNFRAWLDNLHGTSSGLDNRGFYRAILNDSVIEITSSPINYTTEQYIQVVRGRVSVASTTGLLTFSYEYNILERKYSATDGWSSWRVVASADKFEDLYAKAIQIGSFEVESLTDGLGINFSNIDGTQSDSFKIPAATTESAGVMSAEDKRELAENKAAIDTEIERAKTAEIDAIEQGRRAALIDLYRTIGASYNKSTDTFTLNTVAGLSWTDMGTTFAYRDLIYRLNLPRVGQQISNLRVLAPMPNILTGPSINIQGLNTFYGTSIELFALCKLSSTTYDTYLNSVRTDTAPVCTYMYDTFRECSRLKVVFPINLEGCGTLKKESFARCVALEELRLLNLPLSLNLGSSPLISKASILYIITNAAPASAITITLHADAYARLAEDVDIVAALEAQPLITLVSA